MEGGHARRDEENLAADQLFLDQIDEENLQGEELMASARVNTEGNLRLKFNKILEQKFVDRMDQNGAILERFMGDKDFQEAVTRYLLRCVMDAAAGEASP